ncbi:MAG TPA: hypothetical protein DD412_07445 [Holosporales bacterium]|nr:hypothetical protein [Holosporales bacterium]
MTNPIPDVDLKALRKKLGLNQTQFAHRYSINLATLRNWECGKSSPMSTVKLFLFLLAKMPEEINRTIEKYDI